jgi:hypothetical protein
VPTPQLPTEAIAWAKLLDNAPHAGLWTWLRAIDQPGSGVVTFAIADAADILRKTHQTIRSWLKQGQAQQWFRSVARIQKGIYRVHLAGLFVVARRLGLENLGPAAIVLCDRLRDPKRLATDVTAEELQAAARRARIRELTDRSGDDPSRGPTSRKQRRQQINVPTAYDLLSCPPRSNRTPLSSESSTGGKAEDKAAARAQIGVIHRGKRILFVSESANAVGVSQQTIAEHLERSASTIRRRQSLAIRDRLDRPTLLKRQVATKVETGNLSAAQFLARLVCEALDQHDAELLAEARRHFCVHGSLWRLSTNLYCVGGLQPKRFKRRRAAYKAFQKKQTAFGALGGLGALSNSSPRLPSEESASSLG